MQRNSDRYLELPSPPTSTNLRIPKWHQMFKIFTLSLSPMWLDYFCSFFKLLVYVFLNFMGHFFLILVSSEMISSHYVTSLKICMSIENQAGYKGIFIFHSKKQQHNHFCDASNMCMTYHISGMTFKTNGAFLLLLNVLFGNGNVNPDGNDMSINQT